MQETTSEQSADSVRDNEDITWLTCAGQLKVLSQYLNQCNDILNETVSEQETRAEGFVIKVRDVTLKINHLSQQLTKNCSVIIDKVRNQEIELGCPVMPASDQLTSHDPSERPRNMNDDQRKFLIELGPCQPKLKSFPENESIPKNKQNKFSGSWYDSFPHLEYSKKEDKAYCFVCSLFPSGPGRENCDLAWIDGVRSWHKMKSVGTNKQGKLIQHFSCKSHQAALADFVQFSLQSCHIDVLMSEQMKEILIQEKADEERNKEIMAILFDVGKTLARQSLAFRGSGKDEDGNYVQVVNLLSRHCPVLKSWLEDRRLKPYSTTYMSSESQNEMVHLLAQEVKKKIKEEINSAGIFSVSADTTPDTSNQDKLVVAGRYVDSAGLPRERVIEMKESVDKSGAGTAKDIIKSLKDNEIELDMLSFQTYDFTAQCLED